MVVSAASSESGERKWGIVVRFDNADFDGCMWYKADVSEFVNRTLKRHRRHKYRSDGMTSHSHVPGVCDRGLFPIRNKSKRELKKLKEEHDQSRKGKYRKGEPEPHARATCFSDGNSKVYLVGGNRAMLGYSNIASEVYGFPPKAPSPPMVLTKEEATNDSHVIRECDFRQIQIQQSSSPCERVEPEWVASTPLFTPRYCPKTVTIGENIYFFGGNVPPDDRWSSSPCYRPTMVDFNHKIYPNRGKMLPFSGHFSSRYGDDLRFAYAEVFDLALGECVPLPEPPFPRIETGYLVVIPLLGNQGEQKILLVCRGCPNLAGFNVMSAYDVNTSCWINWSPYDNPERDLFFAVDDMWGKPTPVASQNTTYWLCARYYKEKEHTFCAYDWKTNKLYHGPFPKSIPCCYNPEFLHHLTHDVFCLIWETGNDDHNTEIHFTLLRITKNKSAACLDISILGCLCHLVPGLPRINSAHLMSNCN